MEKKLMWVERRTPRQVDQQRWLERRYDMRAFLQERLPTDLSDTAREEIYEQALHAAKKMGFYGIDADADEVMKSTWIKSEFVIKQIVAADRRARLLPQEAEGGKTWTRM